MTPHQVSTFVSKTVIVGALCALLWVAVQPVIRGDGPPGARRFGPRDPAQPVASVNENPSGPTDFDKAQPADDSRPVLKAEPVDESELSHQQQPQDLPAPPDMAIRRSSERPPITYSARAQKKKESLRVSFPL